MTMSCVDNEGEGVAEAIAMPSDMKSSEDKNGGAPIATIAPSPSSSRPPLDIICVLDTSGSMSSDNKLKNLIFAGLILHLDYLLLLIGKFCSELHSGRII